MITQFLSVIESAVIISQSVIINNRLSKLVDIMARDCLKTTHVWYRKVKQTL